MVQYTQHLRHNRTGTIHWGSYTEDCALAIAVAAVEAINCSGYRLVSRALHYWYLACSIHNTGHEIVHHLNEWWGGGPPCRQAHLLLP